MDTIKLNVEIDVKISTLKNHNYLTGTCLQGYLSGYNFKQIKKALKGLEIDPCDKNYFSWAGYINGMIFTIYDYSKRDNIGINKINEWHIGGKNKNIVPLIKAYVKAIIK